MHLTDPSQIKNERCYLDRLGLIITQWAGGIGAALLFVFYSISFFIEEGSRHFYHTYLTSYMFYLSLSLGALAFVMTQHLTRAGWSVVVRRISEIVAAVIPLFIVLFIPILLGLGDLYSWSDPTLVQNDHLLQVKKPYLNITFFLLRFILYFSIWWGLAYFLFSRSVRQDESGDPRLTIQMEKVSAPGMLLFFITLSFAAFDWMMSLEPHWYSTIYGVYFFSGSVLGFLAFFIIVVFLLQKQGCLVHAITIEHYHDLGKLLFAFVFFWGYIAFSQYMLIWYGNIPEETMWYQLRQEGGWFWVSMLLLFGHLLIPFMGLLSRYPKRRKSFLFFWAVWLFMMHYVDIYWLVMPHYRELQVPFHLVDAGCFLGMGGVFIAGLAFIARGCSLVPAKDPRLGESLTFENA